MQNSHKWVTRFRLKSGSWVYVPTDETLREGRILKKIVAHKWKAPANYFHLRDGGHVEALRYHAGAQYFIRADIKKFFNSINRSRITRELKPYFGYEKARQIAMESTASIQTQSGQIFALPFGFPQSTILASLCLSKSRLGKTLERINSTPNMRVSVYVDDIIISCDKLEASLALLAEIENAACRSAFTLNTAKLEGPAQTIGAFNIALTSTSLLIQDWRLQELKKLYDSSDSENQKTGIASYVKSVNSIQAAIFP